MTITWNDDGSVDVLQDGFDREFESSIHPTDAEKSRRFLVERDPLPQSGLATPVRRWVTAEELAVNSDYRIIARPGDEPTRDRSTQVLWAPLAPNSPGTR